MNEHEIDRLASTFHVLRPDWPHGSLRTFIAKNLGNRPRRDVAVALAWIACESNTATPARVLGAGPWWRAAAVEGDVTTTHTGRTVGRSADAREVCGICDMWREDCERRTGISGHEFVSRSECLPPRVPGVLEKSSPCMAGPEDAPCQLLYGHDGAHHCLPPKPTAPPTDTYLAAKSGLGTNEETTA